ncbi:MAG: tetratricopeptide repeat protein [Terriglobia bacterium]
MTPLKVESSCVLAISYSRQGKNAMATEKIAECLSLAKKTNNQQTITYADATNAMVQVQTGNIAGAKAFLENLIAKSPDNPELHVGLAMSLANAKLYDEANSQLDSAIAKLISAGDKKTAAGAYTQVSMVLNLDSSEKAHKLQLHFHFGVRARNTVTEKLGGQKSGGYPPGR